MLLLRKGSYLYEHMDEWEKFDETTLSNVNMEDITDVDCMHGKRVCKDFEIKNLGEHYDLYFKSNTLLLGDIFENVRKMCLIIYELDPVKFLSAPGLVWQAADIDMLLIVEKGIRG